MFKINFKQMFSVKSKSLFSISLTKRETWNSNLTAPLSSHPASRLDKGV